MRGVKSSFLLTPTKLIFISVFFMAMILLILRTNFTSNPKTHAKYQNPPSSCNKLPPAVSNALINYATTNTTPQQTRDEIAVTERVLRRKSPCNFLVFGLGHDSLMWATLNHGGKTLFLEEDENWIREMKARFPTLASRHVTYDTKVSQYESMLASAKSDEECYRVVNPKQSNCTLALKNLSDEIYEGDWDLMMVDAPTGYHDDAPGRMKAIYTAGLMARNVDYGETEVFVHDVDRVVEDVYSSEYLCRGYLVEQVGRLRHFSIPSFKTRVGRSFCPKIVGKN